jgi:hypothetical protein
MNLFLKGNALASFFSVIRRKFMSEVEKVIQFLVCPQEDFVGRLSTGALPSNRLHVGAFATQRLRGNGMRGSRDPYVDTVKRLLNSGHSSNRVHLVLDEDWHARSCEEFPIFGEHCVKGSDGARLVGDLEELRWHPRTHVIRANSLNIAATPRYQEVLSEIVGGTRSERIRVGVFGVWTHVKVEYLLLNLTTMAPRFLDVGVCGPLCASPDNKDHVAALNKFRALGYRVFDHIGEYLSWLGFESEESTLRTGAGEVWTGARR